MTNFGYVFLEKVVKDGFEQIDKNWPQTCDLGWLQFPLGHNFIVRVFFFKSDAQVKKKCLEKSLPFSF